jgi:hypothetical protein
MSRYTPPPISPAAQLVNLRGQNPQGIGSVKNGRLTWQFDARPVPVNRRYRLKLDYALPRPPQIFIIDPNPHTLAAGRTIPHLYDQARAQLCLYLPKTGEWHDRRFLSETFVPWSVLWLLYFEDWLVSDEWNGGGVHVGAG